MKAAEPVRRVGVGLACLSLSCLPGSDETLGPPGPLSDFGVVTGISNQGTIFGSYMAEFSLISGIQIPRIQWIAARDGDNVFYGDTLLRLANIPFVNDSGVTVITTRFQGWYMWTPGSDVQPRPTLGGPLVSPRGMNSSGQVVGIGWNQTQQNISTFYWDGTDMNQIAATGFYRLVDINDLSQILFRGALWENGVMTPFPSDSPFQVRGYAINDRGVVTGSYSAATGSRAFVLENGSYTFLPGIDSLASSSGKMINDRGDVVGDSFGVTGSSSVMLWRGGGAIDLAELAGDQRVLPIDLNEPGTVLFGWVEGRGSFGGWAEGRSFVYEDGVVVDLGLLEGTVATVAVDINDRGQVVGMGHTADGFTIPFLWEDGVLRAITFRRQ